jgi:hypothetical protein
MNFEGLIFILFGLFLMIVYRRAGRVVTSIAESVYPHTKIWKKGNELAFLAGGFAFVILGVLDLIGIIQFKR